MNRVVHFEIYAAEPERAADFYRKVFDWKIEKYDGLDWDYWFVMTADKDSKEAGINGGLMKRTSAETPSPEHPINAHVCTVVVEDIDKTIGKILEAGGKEAMAKFALPGMAWQAYYLDTENNIFGIHQADVNAK